jgi:hypothetical protein
VAIEQVEDIMVLLAAKDVKVFLNVVFASNLVINVEGVRAVKLQNITETVVNIVDYKSA